MTVVESTLQVVVEPVLTQRQVPGQLESRLVARPIQLHAAVRGARRVPGDRHAELIDLPQRHDLIAEVHPEAGETRARRALTEPDAAS